MLLPFRTIPRSLRTELLIALGLVLVAVLGCSTVLFQLLPAGHSVPASIRITVEGLGIFGGVTLVVGYLVIEPLRALARATDQVAAGDLSRRLPLTPIVELNEISAAIGGLTSRVLADQAQLVRAQKLASAGQLASSAAREMGPPLAIAREQIDLLRKRLLQRRASSDELELLAVMERETARMESVVHGLLDYARARPAVASTVDSLEVVRRCVDRLRSDGALKAVDVILELTDEPLLLAAQRQELEQLFVNLLLNAVDATNGRGRIVIRLERVARLTLREPAMRRALPAGESTIAHPPSSRVQRWLVGNDAAEIAKIIVADSGPGVPAALSERIFDPFFTTKPTGKGIGLGLAVAARIVDNMRGTIWVTPAREGGAAFHMLFPLVASSAGKTARSSRRRYTPPVARRRIVQQ
jgi:signal transduction histidine kinase